MSFRTDKQKEASWHNWQIRTLHGIRWQLQMISHTATLTEESKQYISETIDHIDLLITSMKIRR